jgi:hypothetical protein
MGRSSFSEVEYQSICRSKNPHLLWNPKLYDRVRPIGSYQRKLNPVCIIMPYFYHIHFNITAWSKLQPPTCNRISCFLCLVRNKIRPHPSLVVTFRTLRWKNTLFRLSTAGYSNYQAIPLCFGTLKSTTVFANARTKPCLEPRIPGSRPFYYYAFIQVFYPSNGLYLLGLQFRKYSVA